MRSARSSAGSEAAEERVGLGDALGLLDQVGVDEEEVEAGLGEGLLDADAVEVLGRRVFGAGGAATGYFQKPAGR